MCQVTLVVCDSLQAYALWPARLLSIAFSSQEYWSELPRPPPGDLLDTGIEPTSLMALALQVNSSLPSLWGSLGTCLQSRNRDTGIDNKYTDTKGEMGHGMNWETGIDIYSGICIR